MVYPRVTVKVPPWVSLLVFWMVLMMAYMLVLDASQAVCFDIRDFVGLGLVGLAVGTASTQLLLHDFL